MQLGWEMHGAGADSCTDKNESVSVVDLRVKNTSTTVGESYQTDFHLHCWLSNNEYSNSHDAKLLYVFCYCFNVGHP